MSKTAREIMTGGAECVGENETVQVRSPLIGTTPTSKLPRGEAWREGISMDRLGHYSNHDLQESLRRLGGKLAAVRGSGKPRRRSVSRRQRARRPGWVLKAVVQVLDDQGEPMQAKDIHAAVETLLGAPVAWSSVKASLSANVSGTSPRLVRVARGWYVLAG